MHSCRAAKEKAVAKKRAKSQQAQKVRLLYINFRSKEEGIPNNRNLHSHWSFPSHACVHFDSIHPGQVSTYRKVVKIYAVKIKPLCRIAPFNKSEKNVRPLLVDWNGILDWNGLCTGTIFSMAAAKASSLIIPGWSGKENLEQGAPHPPTEHLLFLAVVVFTDCFLIL